VWDQWMEVIKKQLIKLLKLRRMLEKQLPIQKKMEKLKRENKVNQIKQVLKVIKQELMVLKQELKVPKQEPEILKRKVLNQQIPKK
jgi:hypothetical protein